MRSYGGVSRAHCSLEFRSRLYKGVEKSVPPTSGHKQLLAGSEPGMFGLLMDLEDDQQLSGNDSQKEPRFLDVSMMWV
jgi:hypothetical protein